MAKTDFKSVDEYIATFPNDMQEALWTVRRAVKEAIPDAEEGIGYQLPAYRFPGGRLYFGGFKRHYSLFGLPSESLLAFKNRLAAYETSKGTIKFPLDQPVPADLIGALAKHHADIHRTAAKPQRTRKGLSP